MKKKTAILLVGALSLQQPFSGCGKNKEATEAANESVESETRKEKPKTAMMQRKKKKKKQRKLRQQIRSRCVSAFISR